MTNPPQRMGLPLGRIVSIRGTPSNPDRISTTPAPPSEVGPRTPPHDSRGRPVAVGATYLHRYPFEFVLVRVNDRPFDSGLDVTVTRIFPARLPELRASFRARSWDLSPLDPSVIGREVRALLDWFQEYGESLAPVPDPEEEIDHE